MAKKKEIKKDIEKEEIKENKKEKINLKNKLVKIFKNNKSTIIKSTVSVAAIIVVIFVLIASINAIKTNSLDNIDYPLVYQRKNGEIVLLKSKDKEGKDGTILSTSDGTGYTTYGNKSNRYVLTKKGNDLYVFDTKKNNEATKISDDTSIYGFSKEDSYVYLVDSDFDLYSYNFKEAKMLLDAGITSVKDYSDKAIIYEKNDKLYFVSFNPDKNDKVELVNGYKIAEFSEDGKAILYTNSNNALYRFDIKKKKHTKIASDVETFYCDKKSCDKMYYTISEGSELYYYNGKKNKLITENIFQIEDIDVENQTIVFSSLSASTVNLYYQVGTKEPQLLNGEYTLTNNAILADNNIYYTDKNMDLLLFDINSKKTEVISEEIESSLKVYKNGIYFSKNSDEKSNATFYIAVNGKVRKIADDIKETKVVLSNDGKKIYYLKDVENNKAGILYVFDGKENKQVAGNVNKFLYIRDDMVYYITDFDTENRIGNLYRYNGKKSTKIDENISDFSSTPNAYMVK